ncbi:MAG: DUF6377 domain-containing protein [Staphylococcus sp.]|nr:DUF6377 domain-containing protein [Staphylococcus sp.]
MLRFASFILMLVCLAPVCGFSAPRNSIDTKEVGTIINRLDKELERSGEYLGRRRALIDSLKQAVARKDIGPESRLSGMLQLGDYYSALNTDSALSFYSKGSQLARAGGQDSIYTRFELRSATFLPLLGFVSQAETRFDAIDPESLPEGLLIEYYDAARQMYSYLASYYAGYTDIHDTYMKKSQEAQFRLLSLLDEESPRFMLNQGEYFLYHQDYSKAKAVLLLLLDRIPEEDNLYARACHFLADISKVRGEHNAYIYYLALSAIADTRGATLEVSSLQELGRVMYLNGDVDHAYDYLSTALSGAVECNAPLRILQSSQVFPMIENAHKTELRESEIRIYIVMAIMAILLVVLAATLHILHRKNRLMNKMAVNLEEANKTKDVYISQFLNLCSIYMDKLNQFNKMVNRKITNGKVDDLLKLTKQGKFIEEQSKEFYDVFDDAFLHIYPNFVSEVNKLLRPEEHIVLREGEKLNTDLRIIAFMRLGIDESTRIAQMLNYSVYTIYTYRNKLKNRALSRDTFEDDIMKIRSGS